MLFIGDRKERAPIFHRLRVTQKQDAAGPQREVENFERPLLRIAIQVDEQVPARDQIEPRERRILQQIVRRKEHDLAHLPPHAVAARLMDEEAAQPVFAHIRRDRFRVETFARTADHLVIEIGGKHLKLRRRLQRARVFAEQHGDGIRLLARRARRHPDAHGVARTLVLEELPESCAPAPRKHRGRGKNSSPR